VDFHTPPGLNEVLAGKTLPLLSRPHPLLLLSRSVRQSFAENAILHLSTLPALTRTHHAPSHLFASDGSSFTTQSGCLQVAFATFGNGRVFPLSLHAFLGSANILLAEAYGILCQVLLARESSPKLSTTPIILSDHLNSVNLLNNPTKTTPQGLFLHPARSIYRWIMSILESGVSKDVEDRSSNSRKDVVALGSPPPCLFSPLFSYVRAHTDSDTIPAQLNRMVDYVAAHSYRHSCPPPAAPVPTFAMDEYTPHTSALGFFDASVLTVVENDLAQMQAPPPHPTVISYSLYDPHPPPEYPYFRARSSYSAVIQLYARSNQLDSAMHLHTRLHGPHQPWCRFGCVALESVHHIFTQCPRFTTLRHDTVQSLRHSLTVTFESFRSQLSHHPRLCALLDSLFTDGDLWPCAASLYYRGLLPPLVGHLDDESLGHLTSLQHQRLLRRLANDCHTTSVHLAGRIWGIVRRSFSPYHTASTAPPKTVNLPSILSHIVPSPTSHLSIVHSTT
jgi:hypothetical protein